MTKTEFCNEIAKELKGSGKAILPGIGTIKVIQRAARKGRNPATGEMIDIPARKDVKIKASEAFKAHIN